MQTAAAAMFVVAAFSPAQALVIGTADSANGMPFGNNAGGYYYQQVYSAASFGSGINISELTFYNSQSPGGTPRAGTFQIYLSTTNAAIGTFDTNNSVPWLDGSFTQVFNGTIPSLANGRLDLVLSTAFNYNPASGNLLLTVREFSLSNGSTLFLDVDRNVGVTNSRFSAYPYDWNQGLVTGFNDVAVAAPDPTPIPAVGAGLPLVIGAGALIRRWRRRKAA
jgi:hypothetical protein